MKMPTFDNKWVKYRNIMSNQNRVNSLLSRVKLSNNNNLNN